jgi:hypothetical protein
MPPDAILHDDDLARIEAAGDRPSGLQRYPRPGLRRAGAATLGNPDAIVHDEKVLAVRFDSAFTHRIPAL